MNVLLILIVLGLIFGFSTLFYVLVIPFAIGLMVASAPVAVVFAFVITWLIFAGR